MPHRDRFLPTSLYSQIVKISNYALFRSVINKQSTALILSTMYKGTISIWFKQVRGVLNSKLPKSLQDYCSRNSFLAREVLSTHPEVVWESHLKSKVRDSSLVTLSSIRGEAEYYIITHLLLYVYEVAMHIVYFSEYNVEWDLRECVECVVEFEYCYEDAIRCEILVCSFWELDTEVL